MSCETCDLNLIPGKTYNLTGDFVCEGCNNNAPLNPNTAIYHGLTDKFIHLFQMTHEHVCTHCGKKQTYAMVPCGKRLADQFFENALSLVNNTELQEKA